MSVCVLYRHIGETIIVSTVDLDAWIVHYLWELDFQVG